ncbi:hypothetical protein Tco_1420526 [Tanacetum coccineum]
MLGTNNTKVNTDKEKDSQLADEGIDDRTEGIKCYTKPFNNYPNNVRDMKTISNSSQYEPIQSISREKERGVELKKLKRVIGQCLHDEEMARKIQEDWEAEEEVKKLAEEEAIKTSLSNEYDFIQARIEADRLLALRL